MELSGKNIAVLGMGRTGIAAANFLAERGARVTLLERNRREGVQEMPDLHPSVKTVFGTNSPPEDAATIILSPGVDIESEFLGPAKKRGVEILSEIELAGRHTSTPIIAVTGTNGKSTCATVIGSMLEQAGKKAPTGGNLGIPFIELIGLGSPDYFVLEISSFQLEAVRDFRPKIAIVLNLTPDHLDRHKTFERYAQLKANVTARQTGDDVLILNRDDPHTVAMGETSRARKLFFSARSEVAEGAFLRNGSIVTRLEEKEETVCSVSDLKRSIQWQVENILPVVLTARILNLPKEDAAQAIQRFSGLEHRIEWVRTHGGIDFINDSKGTNVGSLWKSLHSMTRPVILIAGGRDKDGDFSALKGLLKEKVKHMVLIGEARPKIRAILNGSFDYEDADGMEDAVNRAYSKAASGDVVLLSPGCASFDMFKNYRERGETFKSIVNRL